jgi:hypothetical protein
MYDPLDEQFPPDKYLRIRGVPVFDEHEGLGLGGKPKKVTPDDLEKIAETCNRKFSDLRVATPLAIGHTLDDARSEKEQPEIVGWAAYFRTGKLGNTGRKALYCDWFVKKKYENVIEDYPHRSIEWYRHTNDINPISLLRSAPERDLPIIKYGKEVADTPYRYVFSPPIPSSSDELMTNANDDMKDALDSQTSTSKGLDAKVEALTASVGRLEAMFGQLLEMVQEESGAAGPDLMDHGAGDADEFADSDDAAGLPDDDLEADDDAKAEPKAKDKKTDDDDKPAKKEKEEDPEKYNSVAGSGNCYVPSTDMEKKKKMSREQDDLIKYERAVAEAVMKATQVYEKENADLRQHVNYMKAKEAITELEKTHRVDFGTPEEKEEETTLFADLLKEDRSGEAFKQHFNKVAKKYKKQKEEVPDSTGVDKANKYSRTQPANTDFKSVEDVEAFKRAWIDNPQLTPDAWKAQVNGVQK